MTPDGGLLILTPIASLAGDVSNFYGGTDAWLCKINDQGDIEWEKTYGNHGYDDGIKIKMTSDTTVLLIGGHSESGGMIDCVDFGGVYPDVWIVEIDLSGNIINQWCYGGTYSDKGLDIIELEEGYAFVATTGSDDGDVSGLHGQAGYYAYTDIWLVIIDEWGKITWQKCLGGYHEDSPIYITQTGDNGYVIFGNTYSSDGDVSGNHTLAESSDVWVVKIDQDGGLAWEHCFGGVADEGLFYTNTILKNDDYNYIIAGQAEYNSFDVDCDLHDFPDMDAWILEVDECALHIPAPPLISPGSDTICITSNPTSEFSVEPVPNTQAYEWSLAPEDAGAVTADSLYAIITWNQEYEGQVDLKARSYNECGYSEWSQPHFIFLYNSLGMDDSNPSGAPIHVYPNPSSDRVIFNLDKGSINEGYIFISDIFGQEIEAIPINANQIIWETSDCKQGIYFYTLYSDHSIYSGKIVVLKKN